MRRVRLLPLTLALTCVLSWLACGVAAAADWPQFQADAAHSGLVEGPAPPYAVTWEHAVEPGGPQGRFGLSAPIVVDDLVVAVGPESVIALDAATGEEAWSVDRTLGPSVPAAVASSADGKILLFTEGWGSGPILPGGTPTPTTPTSPSPSTSTSSGAGGAETFDGPSRLVAVRWPDGKRLWTYDLPQVSRTGVTVMGDLAIVGTNDGSVSAVHVSSGDEAWTADAGQNVDQAIAAADGTVVVPVEAGSDAPASVLGLHAADGSEAWRYEPTVPTLIASAPAIAEGTAFVGFYDGTVQAIGLEDGSHRWSARVNAAAPWAPPAVADGRVDVITVSGQMYAFDATSGALAWDHPRDVAVYRPAPVVVGGAVLMGTTQGQIVAFDAAGGDAIWHQDLGAGSIHAIVATGEAVFAVRGGTDAGVVALTHDASATLLAEPSPTVVQPARFVGDWILAALAVGFLAVVMGRFLAARLGPADLPSAEDQPDDEEDA